MSVKELFWVAHFKNYNSINPSSKFLGLDKWSQEQWEAKASEPKHELDGDEIEWDIQGDGEWVELWEKWSDEKVQRIIEKGLKQ